MIATCRLAAQLDSLPEFQVRVRARRNGWCTRMLKMGLAICGALFCGALFSGQAEAQSPLEYTSNTNTYVQVPWSTNFSIPQFNRAYARLDNIEWYIQPSLSMRADVRNGGSSNIFVNISGNSSFTVRNITSFDQTTYVSASSRTSTTIRPRTTASVSASGSGGAAQGLIDPSDWSRFRGSGSVIFPGSAPAGTPTVTGGGQVQSSSQAVFGGIRIRYFYTDLGMSQAEPAVPPTASSTPTFPNFPSGRWADPQLPGAGLVFTSTSAGGTFSSMTLPVDVYGKYVVYANDTLLQGIFDPGATVNFEPGLVSKIHLYARGAGANLVSMPVQLSFSSSTMNFRVARVAAVAGSGQVYRGSGFESNGGLTAALDKSKVLASSASPQATSYGNVSNYSRGINSLLVDVANLASTNLTADDFTLRLSPPQASGVVNPSTWPAAPVPSAIRVTPGTASTPGRVELAWADNEIENRWLQVIVKPTARTGLAHPVVFYLGHALAEANGTTPYRVTGADLSLIQAAISNDLVDITNVRDINKDRRVTGADLSLVQARISNTIVLNNITVPQLGSAEEGT